MSYGGTCFNCGNPNSGFNQTCPSCKLIEVQEKLLKQQREQHRDYNSHINDSGPPMTWGEILGSIIGLILFISLPVWWLSDMGFWESVVAVLSVPVAVIMMFLTVFGII